MKGNRHTEPQRGVSERNRRKAAALSAEMGSLLRSITRRSGQNCKIKIQKMILQFCRQLVKKVPLDFFDKLTGFPGGKPVFFDSIIVGADHGSVPFVIEKTEHRAVWDRNLANHGKKHPYAYAQKEGITTAPDLEEVMITKC